MSARTKTIEIDGVQAEITWKQIKNCYIRLRPPDGRVQISAPQRMSNQAVTALFRERLDWIRKKQRAMQSRPAPPTLRYLDGEEHFYLGRPYRLQLQHCYRKRQPTVAGDALFLYLKTQGTAETRERLLHDWYRRQLEKLIPPLLSKWEPLIDVKVKEWRVRKMKTRWGTCNTVAHRIWLNLDLIKKPVECIEYVLVHELVHLLEPVPQPAVLRPDGSLSAGLATAAPDAALKTPVFRPRINI